MRRDSNTSRSVDESFEWKSEIEDGESIYAALAKEFNESQHSEGWKDAVKNNPKALLWCKYSPALRL